MIDKAGALQFSHTIQVAHRLYRQEGKCQQIHGHSMKVSLTLEIRDFTKDEYGYATDQEGRLLEFGAVKKVFRAHLDANYDHKLLLNKDDPWAGNLLHTAGVKSEGLPGLIKCNGDPSTENLAGWIAQFCAEEFRCDILIRVEETETNSVYRAASPSPRRAAEPSDNIDNGVRLS